MNRQEAFKNETRRLILEAARKLFREEDLSRCTMRAIAKQAGVSAASVVVHFKNKVALMEATVGEDIERELTRAMATLPADGDLTQRLTHIWRAMYSFYDGNRNFYRALLSSTILSLKEETPYLTAQMDTFISSLEEMIEREKAQGRMPKSVDSHVLSTTLVSQYFGVLILFFRDTGITPVMAGDLVEAMTRQALAGIETY